VSFGSRDAPSSSLREPPLRGLGLPVRVPRDADVVALLARLARDKKRGPGERHTFVLPRAGGGVLVADDVAEGEIAAALDAART
jgi:3-dehydroquinate synthetase